MSVTGVPGHPALSRFLEGSAGLSQGWDKGQALSDRLDLGGGAGRMDRAVTF